MYMLKWMINVKTHILQVVCLSVTKRAKNSGKNTSSKVPRQKKNGTIEIFQLSGIFQLQQGNHIQEILANFQTRTHNGNVQCKIVPFSDEVWK